jgi:hypothetical protein
MVMTCEECVFYSRLQQNRSSTPCISCTTDPSDKGYCIAINSEFGFVPVISKIFDEARAREIIARGTRNGSSFELLLWSKEINAYRTA